MGAMKQFLIGVAEKFGLDPADPEARELAQKELDGKMCRACTLQEMSRDGLCDDCTEDMWSQYNEENFTEEDLDDMEEDFRY